LIFFQEISAIKKNQEVLEAKAKIKRASDEKMVEAREKVVALRKGKQELVNFSFYKSMK
jgi:late competence protein required for DNA uptake (superfamily II DNA/RNA helicase)